MLRKQFCMFGEASKDQTGSSLAGWLGRAPGLEEGDRGAWERFNPGWGDAMNGLRGW